MYRSRFLDSLWLIAFFCAIQKVSWPTFSMFLWFTIILDPRFLAPLPMQVALLACKQLWILLCSALVVAWGWRGLVDCGRDRPSSGCLCPVCSATATTAPPAQWNSGTAALRSGLHAWTGMVADQPSVLAREPCQPSCPEGCSFHTPPKCFTKWGRLEWNWTWIEMSRTELNLMELDYIESKSIDVTWRAMYVWWLYQ